MDNDKLKLWYISHIMKIDETKEFEIIFYEKNGHIPVKDFLESLDSKMKSKIIGLIVILSQKGNLLRKPYSEALEDGIFELRCQVGNNITRILYFFYYNKKIIMTNGFIKKTQKTPRNQIEIAKKRKIDFIERNK